tara:strand:+ start:14878 stop:16314 length:1437 start_codon:yes stop_codon:yes gene_type:complete
MNVALQKKEKQSIRSVVKTKYFLIISLIILVLPFLIRSNFIIPGDDSYLINRIAETIIWNFNLSDQLSFAGRPLVYPLGTILFFSLFSKLNNLVFLFLPGLFGILSSWMFVKILKKFNIDNVTILVSFIILLLSNTFLYNFTTVNFFMIPVFLMLLGFYLFLNNKYVLSLVLFSLMPFFGFFNFITSFFLVSLYLIYKKENRKLGYYILGVFITSIIAFLWQIVKFGLPDYSFQGFAYILQNIITEFNGFGVSLFVIVLGLIGLKKLWENKYKYNIIYLYLFMLSLLVFFEPKLIIYLTFLLSYLAALGLIKIYNTRWEVNSIKKITIAILIFGIIFSGFGYTTKFESLEPNKNIQESLEYIRDTSNKEDVVFSHYKNGIFINSIAQRENFIDKNFLYVQDIDERIKDNEDISHSRNLEKTKKLLNKYGIRYIYVTKDMTNGLVWNDDNDGLLFVARFSENFIEVYENDDVQIWKYFP